MKLILGSSSPQRKKILSFYALPFEQASPNFPEESILFEGDPVAYATTLSEAKAAVLAPNFHDAIILTADTVVFKDGKIFNKPSDDAENFAMLQTLNGSTHSVFTAVTALCNGTFFSEYAQTQVEFHRLNEAELKRYHQAYQGLDKAGGYGIQAGGYLIVKKIEGCFYNVMGLPITALQKVLGQAGINLWDYLVSSPSS